MCISTSAESLTHPKTARRTVSKSPDTGRPTAPEDLVGQATGLMFTVCGMSWSDLANSRPTTARLELLDQYSCGAGHSGGYVVSFSCSARSLCSIP